MATGKRYYWIKLKDTFFTSDTVDFFMGQPDGANYVVLYQMLCLMTANTDGRFSRQIGEMIIPYDVSKIKRDCKYFSEDTIRVALDMYKRFGLIYEDQDGILVMADHDNLVGSETDYAHQKRLQRESLKLSQGDKNEEKVSDTGVDTGVDIVHKNVHIDIRDKRLDIRDKNINNTYVCSDGPKRRKRGTYTPEFEEFWKVYPRQIGKIDAFKAWSARLKEGYTEQQMIDGAMVYAQAVKKNHTEEQYRKHPKTFLGVGLHFMEFQPKEEPNGDDFESWFL